MSTMRTHQAICDEQEVRSVDGQSEIGQRSNRAGFQSEINNQIQTTECM